MAKRDERFETNPKTDEKLCRTVNVFVYGLSPDEIDVVENSLPNKRIAMTDCTDCFTDIIAMSYIAVIMNPDYLVRENIEYFNQYTEDVGTFTEKIIFTKDHPLLRGLNKNVPCTIFKSDAEFEDRLKYLLLEANKADKRSESYSETISQTIRVLSEIRKHPYITTAELAELIERNPRTVQRYIRTLNCAGEFINYDKKKKGWFLFENKSVLWGDY